MSQLLDYPAVLEAVPEGPPHLMVDRIELADDLASARAVKAVSMGEAFFQGHFPGAPILPGVLQLAAMAQVGSVVIGRRESRVGAPFRIVSLKRIKFRRPVRPGDLMLIETVLKGSEDGVYEFQAKTLVRGQVTSQGTLRLVLVDAVSAVPPLTALESGEYSPDEDLSDWLALDVNGVMACIPHRFPFQLTDTVKCKGNRAIGRKNVTGNEPYFRGAALPWMPEYLVVEAAAQTGCVVVLSQPGHEGKLGYFLSIDKADFHAAPRPGETLMFDVQHQGRGRFGVAVGTVFAGDILAAELLLKFAVVDREEE
jgi:3-hydroxymyristoyl/3-hydroxydecanoyl-(acyl carrier protein) dehydratase